MVVAEEEWVEEKWKWERESWKEGGKVLMEGKERKAGMWKRDGGKRGGWEGSLIYI